MTFNMLTALRAMGVADDTLLYATTARQSSANLNAAVAVGLRKLGLIQRAPDWLASRSTGHGDPWVLTDKGVEALGQHEVR